MSDSSSNLPIIFVAILIIASLAADVYVLFNSADKQRLKEETPEEVSERLK